MIKTILFYKLCEAQFTFMFMTFRNHVHLTPVSKLRLAPTLPPSPRPGINFVDYFFTAFKPPILKSTHKILTQFMNRPKTNMLVARDEVRVRTHLVLVSRNLVVLVWLVWLLPASDCCGCWWVTSWVTAQHNTAQLSQPGTKHNNNLIWHFAAPRTHWWGLHLTNWCSVRN